MIVHCILWGVSVSNSFSQEVSHEPFYRIMLTAARPRARAGIEMERSLSVPSNQQAQIAGGQHGVRTCQSTAMA